MAKIKMVERFLIGEHSVKMFIEIGTFIPMLNPITSLEIKNKLELLEKAISKWNNMLTKEKKLNKWTLPMILVNKPKHKDPPPIAKKYAPGMNFS